MHRRMIRSLAEDAMVTPLHFRDEDKAGSLMRAGTDIAALAGSCVCSDFVGMPSGSKNLLVSRILVRHRVPCISLLLPSILHKLAEMSASLGRLRLQGPGAGAGDSLG